MPVHRTQGPAAPLPSRANSGAALQKEALALYKKLDGRDEVPAFETAARLIKYGGSSAAGKRLVALTRKATPEQAKVLHDLLHQRLDGADAQVPRGQAAFAKKVQKEIDHVGGGDDLSAMRNLALTQAYRDGLSPAGRSLLDGLRTGTSAQVDAIHAVLTQQTSSSAARYAGWSPR